jgi:hypothetical protein
MTKKRESASDGFYVLSTPYQLFLASLLCPNILAPETIVMQLYCPDWATAITLFQHTFLCPLKLNSWMSSSLNCYRWWPKHSHFEVLNCPVYTYNSEFFVNSSGLGNALTIRKRARILNINIPVQAWNLLEDIDHVVLWRRRKKEGCEVWRLL